MKKIATSLLALLAGTVSVFAQFTSTSGGPDSYGYTWRSSDDAGAPAFNWVDISTSGTDITNGLGDDNAVSQITYNDHVQYFTY